MKKIAIFAEGQTELIFVRNILIKVLDISKLSFECLELLANKESTVPYQYPNPNAEVHFLILNVRGDETVLSSIKEREKNLIEKRGYDKIIGLRDMYSYEYIRRSPRAVNDEISKMIIQRYNQTIGNMTYSDRIRVYFAIMEIEAWILGMYTIFHKIDSLLTMAYIKQNLNVDLKTVDPQKEFYKPSEQLHSIFQLCGREYKKKRDEIESICSNIDSNDFDTARENNRCKCFDDFYKEITSYR